MGYITECQIRRLLRFSTVCVNNPHTNTVEDCQTCFDLWLQILPRDECIKRNKTFVQLHQNQSIV